MKPAKRLLSVLSIIAFTVAIPLSANAKPQLVTHRAKCNAAESDIITIDGRPIRELGLQRSKFVQARVAAGSQNNAGVRAKVVGLGKPSPGGLRFKTFIVTAKLDPDRVVSSNCFVVLDFDMPGTEPDQRRIVSFNEARLHNTTLSNGFKMYAFDNVRHVKGVENGALKAAAVLLQGGGTIQELIIGDMVAAHSGAVNSDVELWLIGEQESCDLLPPPK